MRFSGLISVRSQNYLRVLGSLGLFLAVLLLLLFFSLTSDAFLSGYNFSNILKQITTLALVSYGMTFVIIGGGIDLSVGSIIGLVSVLSAMIIKQMDTMWLGIIVSLLVSLSLAGISGVLITRYKVQSFIQTLAMGYVAYGAALVLSNSQSIADLPKGFLFFGNAYILMVPIQAWFTLAAAACCYILLHKTVYGARLFATGGNLVAASLSGVGVSRIVMSTYLLSAFFSCFASIIATSRTLCGQPNLGSDIPLLAIAACIIGGASLQGGRGSIAGTTMGVLFMGILANGLNIAGVSTYMQDVLVGSIIVGASWLDSKKRSRVNLI